MDEFGHQDVFRPFQRVMSTEGPEVCFNLGINSFCFPIRFGVIGGGEGKFVTKYSSEFFGESSGKLRSAIKNDLVKKSKMSE